MVFYKRKKKKTSWDDQGMEICAIKKQTASLWGLFTNILKKGTKSYNIPYVEDSL